MIGFVREHATQFMLGGVLALAGISGAFVASALSAGTQQTPQRTVTINVANGATGPAGPRGPQGPTGPAGPGGGAESCPAGSTFGKLIINGPQGHTAIFTCFVDE